VIGVAPDAVRRERDDDRDMKLRVLRHADAGAVVSAGEVRRACLRYLAETREAAPDAYLDIEERAWRRLVSNLRALGVSLDATGLTRDAGTGAETRRVPS